MKRLAAVLGVLVLILSGCGDSNDTGSGTGGGSTTTTGGDEGEFTFSEFTPLLIHEGPDVVPVRGSDHKYHLLWEVPLQNATSLDLTVTAIEVTGDDGETVLSLDAEQTAEVVEVMGTRTADPEIGPAQSAYAFLTTSFDSLEEVPSQLTHTVTVTAAARPDGVTNTGGTVAVDADAVVPVVGPPVEPGENYIAADTCCTSTRHIRAGLPVENGFYFVQRYAVDWEQVNDDGQFVVGDPSDPENYVIYGKNVLAAADGEVVLVLDGLEDGVPGELPGTSIPLNEADGNTIVVDIGDGLYTAYAHLQKGSVQVEVGDVVERGDVIARVGNTGNSSAPHMHFHVLEGHGTFAANGRPYVIDSFVATGKGESTDNFDEVENTETPLTIIDIDDPGERTDETPLDLWIVDFP